MQERIREIPGERPSERGDDTVTQTERGELSRREGQFRWRCLCLELGLRALDRYVEEVEGA